MKVYNGMKVPWDESDEICGQFIHHEPPMKLGPSQVTFTDHDLDLQEIGGNAAGDFLGGFHED